MLVIMLACGCVDFCSLQCQTVEGVPRIDMKTNDRSCKVIVLRSLRFNYFNELLNFMDLIWVILSYNYTFSVYFVSIHRYLSLSVRACFLC